MSSPAPSFVPDSDVATPVISLDRLEVAFPRFRLSIQGFDVQPGCKVAIIGPNGAGKSTFVEAILGVCDARVAKGRIAGVELRRWQADATTRNTLGVQLQRASYPPDLKVCEIIALHRALYRHRDSSVGEAFAIGELLPLYYRTLSTGQKQRVHLYMALAHRPKIAILDEPYTGLDRRFAGNLKSVLGRSDLAMLMICHAAEEVELADDIAWIAGGGLRKRGSRDAFKTEFVGHYKAHIGFASAAAARGWIERLRNESWVCRLDQPSERAVRVFGLEAMATFCRGALRDEDIETYQFAPSDFDDLLKLCASGE